MTASLRNLVSGGLRGLDRAWIGTRTLLAHSSSRPSACFLLLHSIGGLDAAPYLPRTGLPSLSTDDFRRVLQFFARRGYITQTASQFATRHRAGQIEPRTLVITFDDGFADNYTTAAPILREFNMTATFYVVCGWIGRQQPVWLHRATYYLDRHSANFVASVRHVAGNRWSRFFALFRSSNPGYDAMLLFRQALRPAEQRAILSHLARAHGHPPDARLYMTWNQVAELQRAGMEIGAHTMTHRSFWTLEPEIARAEIERPRRILEKHLNVPVTSFAYPYGHYLPDHVTMVADAGYTNAVTVRPQPNDVTVSLHELGRYGLNTTTLGLCELGRIALGGDRDLVGRVNQWLGRHTDCAYPDPELGLIQWKPRGVSYDTATAAVVLTDAEGWQP